MARRLNPPKPAPLAERFFRHVTIADKDECWPWQGEITDDGYGKFKRDGSRLAHRASYELIRGQIPEGLTIDHLCENERCVNPYHMEPVPERVNILRGHGVGGTNARKTHCIRGHEFTEENILRVRTRPRARHCRECDRLHQLSRRKRGTLSVLALLVAALFAPAALAQKDPCSWAKPPSWCFATPTPTPTPGASVTPTRPLPTPTPTVAPTVGAGGGTWDLVVPVPNDFFTTGTDGFLWLKGGTKPYAVLLRRPDGTCVTVKLSVSAPVSMPPARSLDDMVRVLTASVRTRQ